MVERICPICGCKIVITDDKKIILNPSIRGLFNKILCSECKKFIKDNTGV